MAIYHLSAKIVPRREGRSVVAAAAYRAGQRLEETATGLVFDYTHKSGVDHTEILAPEASPAWVHDRQQLWNAVEEGEKRRDAQLAREIELGFPLELNRDAQTILLRDYVQREFVSKGMIADCAIHRNDTNNPHAHVLLTLRTINENGFGLKERSWNERSKLLAWRIGWEDRANEHLARAGLAIRIDHRTLEAQGLQLIPGRKIGISLERQRASTLPHRIADRIAEQQRIAKENGTRILANPRVALKAITHCQLTFTPDDIARFLSTRTLGEDQFRQACLKVSTSPDLIEISQDCYTTREILDPQIKPTHRSASMTMQDIDAVQQAAANRWRNDHNAEPSMDTDERLAPEHDLDHPLDPDPDDDLELP